MKAEAEPPDAQRVAERAHLVEVRLHLGGGLVHGAEGGAGELELRAGLEGDRGAVLRERDDRSAVVLALDRPAGEGEPVENGRDAPLARVGHGPPVGTDAGLLRLGAHPMIGRGLDAQAKRREQLLGVAEERALGGGGHRGRDRGRGEHRRDSGPGERHEG